MAVLETAEDVGAEVAIAVAALDITKGELSRAHHAGAGIWGDSGRGERRPKYLSIVLWLGVGVKIENRIIIMAEPNTIGTTVMNPFQKLTSPRGFKKSTLMASLPCPSC